MTTAAGQIERNLLEARVVQIGFVLAALVLFLTTISFAANTAFSVRWLVWACAAAFAAVGLGSLDWARALEHQGVVPGGRLRKFLLVGIPFPFLLSSQVCGPGLSSCTPLCNVINIALIALGTIIAVRVSEGRTIRPHLIALIGLGIVPHCVCDVNANVLWHRWLGFSPACEVAPLTASLFAIAGLRGVRPRSGATFVTVLFGMILFMAVGSNLFGFPWEKCVDQVVAAH